MYNGTPTLSFFASVSRFYDTAPWYYYLPQALLLLSRPALPFVPQAIFVQVRADLIYRFTLWFGLARCSLLWDRRKSPSVPTGTSDAHSFPAFQHTYLVVRGQMSPWSLCCPWHLPSTLPFGTLLGRSFASSRAASYGIAQRWVLDALSFVQSRLHRPISVWRMSCVPPWKYVHSPSVHSLSYYLFLPRCPDSGEELGTFQDETDFLFRDSATFLSARFSEYVDDVPSVNRCAASVRMAVSPFIFRCAAKRGRMARFTGSRPNTGHATRVIDTGRELTYRNLIKAAVSLVPVNAAAMLNPSYYIMALTLQH